MSFNSFTAKNEFFLCSANSSNTSGNSLIISMIFSLSCAEIL
ncbi:hypothetical protein LIZ09_00960 [Tyzzerella nexilis]|nr:hypothetical protein [[Clostridium] nexile]MCB7556004.1 hypothetical protein [[Clostridium] nexile]MCC3674491.1 hypothetical protein [[Clostridium] nexile]